MLPKLKFQHAVQNNLPFQKNSINLNCIDSYQDSGQNALFDSSKSSIWNARNISQKIINETKDTKILRLKNTPLRPRTRQNLGNLNQHIKQRSINKIQNKQSLDKSLVIQQKINLSILEQDSQLADNQSRQQRKQQSLTPFGEPFNFKPSYLKQSPLQSNADQNLINQSIIYDPVYSFYAQSKIGKIKSQKKKENQDSHCELTDFGNVKFNYLFSVMDGHGSFGHQASQFTKK